MGFALTRLSRLILALIALLVALPVQAEIQVLSSGPVIADGQTSTTLRFLITDFNPGDRFTVDPDEGRAGTVTVSPEGTLSFGYVPPRLAAPQTLNFKFLRKGAVKSTETVGIAGIPGFDSRLQVSFDPPRLRLQDGTAVVHIAPAGPTAQDTLHRTLLLRASEGTIDLAFPAGDGTWVSRYTAPTGLAAPRTIVVTAADAAAPDTIQGWATLPILVPQAISLEAPPDSSVILTAGGRTFGPVKAAPAGTASVEVELDPAVPMGRMQVVTIAQERWEKEVILPLPDFDRVAFMPLPAMMTAGAPWPIRLITIEPSGSASREATPTLRASTGVVSAVQATTTAGVYEATFTPPDTLDEVTLTASFQGGEVQATTRVVALPVRVDLAVQPIQLPKGQRDFDATIHLRDARGTALPARLPRLDLTGATLVGKIKDNGDGTYTAKCRAAASGEVKVLAWLPAEAKGTAPRQLLVVPRTYQAPADGLSRVSVIIVVMDRFGLPVPGIDVALAVPKGEATLPPTAKTDERGVALVDMKTGQTPGLVTLRAEAAGLQAEAPVLLTGAGFPPLPDLAPGGAEPTLTTMGTWCDALPLLTLSREGDTPVAGPPATIAISTIPPYTTPGAAILANIRIMDAAGLGLSGMKPRVEAAPGTVGAFTDSGNGNYSVPIQLAPGQDGPLSLRVTVGNSTQSTSLPTLASSMAVAGTVTTAAPAVTPTVAPTTAATPAAPKTPKPAPDNDKAFLRADGALTLLAHDYHMESSGLKDAPAYADFANGNLLKGEMGGSPAFNVGFQARFGALPVGIDANAMAWYEMVEINKQSYSNLGWSGRAGLRYIYDMGPLSVYGSGGVQRTTAVIFRYADIAKSSAEMLVYPLLGGRLAAGGAWETGRFWSEFEASTTLAPYPVIGGLGVKVGVEVSDGLYIMAGFAPEWRSMTFAYEDTDEEVKVKDKQQPLMIGIGTLKR